MGSAWHRLAEALGLAEAPLDLDKFSSFANHKTPMYKKGMEPKPPPPDPRETERQSGQAASRQEMSEVMPLVRNDQSFKKIDGKPGWSKTKHWYVNSKHWGKGKPREKNAISTQDPEVVTHMGPDDKLVQGGEWLVPKSGPARTFVTRMHYAELKSLAEITPEVWKKHFQKEFGDNPNDDFNPAKSESVLRRVFTL